MEVSSSEYNTRHLQAGDIVLVEGHAQVTELGRAAIVPTFANGYVFQNHLFRVRVAPGLGLSQFVCEYINGPSGRQYFRSFGGTTSGLNTVSATSVRALPVPLPSLEEQAVIVRGLASVDGRLASEIATLGLLHKTKTALAGLLLSGRCCVSEAHLTE
jgi:restriction endonuclease S subunit